MKKLTKLSNQILLICSLLFSTASYSKDNFDFSPTINYSNIGTNLIEKTFVADMNNDAFTDVVIVTANNEVKVLINNTMNSYTNFTSNLALGLNSTIFTSAITLNAGEYIIGVKDFDNDIDHYPDLLTYLPGALQDELKIYPNTGTSFGTPTNLVSIAHANWEFGTLDMNNDSKDDIYAFNPATGNVEVYLVGFSSTFTNWYNVGIGAHQFYPCKFTSISYNNLFCVNAANQWQFLVNSNGSSFTPNNTLFPAPPPSQIPSGAKVICEDFDNDGNTDVMLFEPVGSNWGLNLYSSTSNTVNNWANTLSPPSGFKLITKDFTNDNKIDILFYSISSNPAYNGLLYSFINVGNSFGINQWETIFANTSSADCNFTAADFDNDGINDLLMNNPATATLSLGLMATHLEGYCWPLSQFADGTSSIDFHINGLGTTTVEIFKYTSNNENVIAHIPIGGGNSFTIQQRAQFVPAEVYKNGCGWTNVYNFVIPSTWESGYYAARLVDKLGREDYITFIVKSPTPSNKKVLLVANTNTWQAYNNWNNENGDYSYSGGMSKYSAGKSLFSFLRPNPAARPTNCVNCGLLNSEILHLTRSELWIYTWLLDNGYEPSVIADMDIETSQSYINSFAYLIIGTHPEYWTENMYDHVKVFQKNGASNFGGNLICIGGNAVFEVCSLDNTNKQIKFYDGMANDSNYPLAPSGGCFDVGGLYGTSNGGDGSDRFDYFFQTFKFPPNNSILKLPIDLIGVHYGNINTSNYSSSAYEINSLGASSPIMQGVGIAGSSIGNCGYNGGRNNGILTNGNGGKAAGWECDLFSDLTSPCGITPALTTSPPIYTNLQILAASNIGTTSPSLPNGDHPSEIIYVPSECGTNNRGFVFTAGSIMFGGSLVCDPQLSQMMKNVLNNESYNNILASSLGTSSVSNTSIFVYGTFTVDQPITFTNCTFYFTTQAKIILTGSSILELNGCNLKAGCNEQWDGIYASDQGSEVNINNCNINDMENGIVISNFAKLIANNNTHFSNNNICIQLQNLPSNYNGLIENCIFKTTTNLLAPYSTQTRGKHGIKIIDCEKINIGNPSNSLKNNHFENLFNGIYIQNNLVTNPVVNTSYNTFKNIGGAQSIWEPYSSGIPFNQNSNGCAIYGINAQILSGIKLIHTGLNNNATKDFENCQQAILTNLIATEISKNFTYQTEAAFLIYSNGQINSIIDNHIDDTYLGILVSGSSWGGIDYNIISNIKSTYSLTSNPANNYIYYGKGIDWQQFVYPSTGGLVIAENEISCDATDFVVGINISNAKNGLLRNNSIAFNSTIQTASLSSTPNLIGLSLNKVNGLEITENKVQGSNTNGEDARRTCGIYMQRSPNNYLHCNINDALQQGITVVGNCEGVHLGGPPNQVNGGTEQNRVTTTRYGWLFRHLTTNGTLGDVGEFDNANNMGIYDANNKFYAVSNAPNFKVHRVFPTGYVCDPNMPQPTIYTADILNLQQSMSSNNLSNACSYKVRNDIYATTAFCNPSVNIAPDISGDGMSLEEALDIANNDIVYTEFEDMGENYDERELFAYLVKDSTRRLQYPVLNQFYFDRKGSSLDQLNGMDILMDRLTDTFTLHNVSLFNELLAQAKTLNSEITETEYHIQNEKQINALQLTVLEFGSTSLSTNNWEWIRDLAQECPFVAGNGVYKARMLYSGINPMSYFDDLKICNSVGVAKNSNGLFDSENKALDSISAQIGNKVIYELEANNIKVFPNPSSDMVTIQYHLNAFSVAQFQLLDMQGRIIKSIELEPSINSVQFSINGLTSAMYTYRYLVNNSVVENGKFIKE